MTARTLPHSRQRQCRRQHQQGSHQRALGADAVGYRGQEERTASRGQAVKGRRRHHIGGAAAGERPRHRGGDGTQRQRIGAYHGNGSSQQKKATRNHD
jgi:hypothetical protein